MKMFLMAAIAVVLLMPAQAQQDSPYCCKNFHPLPPVQPVQKEVVVPTPVPLSPPVVIVEHARPPKPLYRYAPYDYRYGDAPSPYVRVEPMEQPVVIQKGSSAREMNAHNKAGIDRMRELPSCVARMAKIDKDPKRAEALCVLAANQTEKGTVAGTDNTNAAMTQFLIGDSAK